MGEFSILLEQLQASVNGMSNKEPLTVCSNRILHFKPNHRGNDKQSKKRQRNQMEPNEHIVKTRSKPVDIHQLTVTISFLCIGTQKGGTTWLHDMLCRHPCLSLAKTKEVHFWDWHRDKGLGWYSHQFPDNGNNTLLFGEITPCYSVLPAKDISEIQCLFPNVRLIFIARDMVERAWSAVVMELRNAVKGIELGAFETETHTKDVMKEPNTRQLEDKHDRDADPNQYSDSYFMERLQHSTHSTRSNYAMGLQTWLDYFPTEQLLIMDYRELAIRPRRFLDQIGRHIGVESSSWIDPMTDEELRKRINAAMGSSKKTIRPSLRRKMEAWLRPLAKDFNILLHTLNYEWKLSEYEET